MSSFRFVKTRFQPTRTLLLSAGLLLAITSPVYAQEPEVKSPDSLVCGLVPLDAEDNLPIPCDLPGLPCGPVPASGIRTSVRPGADLDGDGLPDLAFLGRRGGADSASYSVIYRGTPSGYVLSDYHEVPYNVGPTVAKVVLPINGQAPIIQDGRDEPVIHDRSISLRRLRRFDGKRFQTLIKFCNNLLENSAGKQVRSLNNRVSYIDVDKSGTKEVLIAGALPPTVYRLTTSGLGLEQDAALTTRYRDNSPAQRRANALRALAVTHVKASLWSQAAKDLRQAHLVVPDSVEVMTELAPILLRLHRVAEVIPLMEQAQRSAPNQAAPSCYLADAYAQLGQTEAESKSLEACLAKDPTPEQRKTAEVRLQIIKKG